ncbi:Putative protein of unknown function [Podospora comata]|uniref:Autophagy-related protein 27 n=1 Tax=Podospora comata TaxID=48703 RepID=A0ABY6SGS5_PODCO|nr:Putative protein of unknown function [Podospora comata]
MVRMHLIARLLASAGLCQIAAASFWTATQIFVDDLEHEPFRCDPAGATGLSCTGTTTVTRLVARTTSLPDVTPISTTTASLTSWDLEVVEYYYPANAVPTSDLYTWRWDPDPDFRGEGHQWLVDYTITAPTSCPTPFEYTTEVNLRTSASVPTPLSEILHSMASVETDVVTYTRFVATTDSSTHRWVQQTSYYTYTTLHVKATDLPPARRPPADYYRYDQINYRYIENCFLPGEKDPRPNPFGAEAKQKCPHKAFGRCSKIPEEPAIILATVGTLFVLGFIENFLWFRSLMQGHWALRCGTVCWWLIATLLMIFVTKYEVGRNKDDQEQLREQWKRLPFWMKIKLWLQWGFRLKYPERWLGARKPVSVGERIEMGIGGGGNGAGGGAGTGGPPSRAPEHDDTPLPVYPGPPHSSASDGHSMNSGTTATTRGPALGNPNAVLGPVLGSGTVVIGPTISSAQQTPASPRRQETGEGPANGAIRAV